jgi:hypothetical protein
MDALYGKEWYNLCIVAHSNFFTEIRSFEGDPQFGLRSLSTSGNHYIKNGCKNEIQYIVLILVIVHYIYTNYINFN